MHQLRRCSAGFPLVSAGVEMHSPSTCHYLPIRAAPRHFEPPPSVFGCWLVAASRDDEHGLAHSRPSSLPFLRLPGALGGREWWCRLLAALATRSTSSSRPNKNDFRSSSVSRLPYSAMDLRAPRPTIGNLSELCPAGLMAPTPALLLPAAFAFLRSCQAQLKALDNSGSARGHKLVATSQTSV